MTVLKEPFRFAVIADAHFHDLHVDFGFAGIAVGDDRLVMRPLGDVARSPRVYNEAGMALRFVLDDLALRGIRHVVLLGDYSDDGQRATIEDLERLLDLYRHQHGMHFHAVPGNHDIFGENGRHRRKRYLTDEGDRMLVTSDPDFEPERGFERVVSDRMYCGGYPDNLPRNLGFFGAENALHWETPFGLSPDPADRQFDIVSEDGSLRRRLMDASYLVEPAPGLWFAMVDANVFVPDGEGDDGFTDSTSAGWNAVLTHKPFILEWLRDVARRARETGKRLLVFSHYPVLDPIDGTLDAELSMMQLNGIHLRVPPPHVGEALRDAGVQLHFSGHVHINDTARIEGADGRSLVNVAVPSLVAFPAAAKLVTVTEEGVEIDTLSIDSMPLDPRLLEAYRLEHALTGVDTGAMRQAEDYGRFVRAHLRHATRRRFLKREWPQDLAVRFRSDDLAQLAKAAGYHLPPDLMTATSRMEGVDFLADWYSLRMGGELGMAAIGEEQLALYRRLVELEPGPTEDDRLTHLFATLKQHLQGLSDRTVIVRWDR